MLRSPSASLGLALTAVLAACSANVRLDDECGPPPPPGACGSDFSCVDGEWRSDGDALCFVPCPVSLPADGESCAELGQSCSYEEDQPCGPISQVTAECTEEGWVSFWTRCQPEPICPEELPTIGGDCSEWYDAYFCSYDLACAAGVQAQVSCNFSTDPPTWQLDSDAIHCDDCGSVSSDAECGVYAVCDWKVPGCAPNALTEGCYPVEGCDVAPSCGPTEICVPQSEGCPEGVRCDTCDSPYHACVEGDFSDPGQ